MFPLWGYFSDCRHIFCYTHLALILICLLTELVNSPSLDCEPTEGHSQLQSVLLWLLALSTCYTVGSTDPQLTTDLTRMSVLWMFWVQTCAFIHTWLKMGTPSKLILKCDYSLCIRNLSRKHKTKVDYSELAWTWANEIGHLGRKPWVLFGKEAIWFL